MMLRSVDCNQPSYRVCFAAVVSCVTNAATVPTYETWEATSPEPCKWCFTERNIMHPVSFPV